MPIAIKLATIKCNDFKITFNKKLIVINAQTLTVQGVNY